MDYTGLCRGAEHMCGARWGKTWISISCRQLGDKPLKCPNTVSSSVNRTIPSFYLPTKCENAGESKDNHRMKQMPRQRGRLNPTG